MIRHIVIVNYLKKFGVDGRELLESTRPFINEIPGIVNYKLFSNKSKYVPDGVQSVGVEIVFEDEDSLEEFMNHPKHYEANALFENYLADPPYMVLTHEIEKERKGS